MLYVLTADLSKLIIGVPMSKDVSETETSSNDNFNFTDEAINRGHVAQPYSAVCVGGSAQVFGNVWVYRDLKTVEEK